MLKKSHHLRREANLIAGNWVGADSGATIEVINPANGEVLGTVPNVGRAETKRAIEAAAAAFETFRHTTAAERAGWLRNVHAAILDNQDALAELLLTGGHSFSLAPAWLKLVLCSFRPTPKPFILHLSLDIFGCDAN